MPQSDKSQPDPLSKSQRKRDMLDLQTLGKTLIDLPPSQLAKIELPENLLEAIHLAHTLKSHESIRRHLQYIGKIMREIDPEPIKAALAKIKLMNERRTEQFHLAEQWRDQLIAGNDDVLQRFLEDYPACDRQQLRQWVRKAKNDQLHNKKTGGELGLFRYLRDLIG